jgi:plastocyanin
MSKSTSRRNLLKIAAGGGIAAGLGMSMKSGSEAKPTPQSGEHGNHGHKPNRIRGPLSSATVSFGAWAADPEDPLDRNPNLAPLDRNVHLLIPDEVTIQAGGVVQFIVQGAHQIAVYDHGTRPDDIGTTADFLVPPAAGGPAILINDPRKRIYRGLDFSTLPTLGIPPAFAPPPASPQFLTDRVEAVLFPNPGNYLVICTIVFHFMPMPGEFEMYGRVRVVP